MGRFFTRTCVWILIWIASAATGLARATEVFTPGESGLFAQTFMNSDSTAGPGKRLPGFELFDDAMRLTKQHYADPVNEREALERTLERITLSLPPHCTEDAISFRDCSRSAQTCFKEVISQIAARCNIKTDRLVVRAVNIFMQSLDANSSLLDAEMLKELKIGTSGQFGGIGIVVSPKDGDYIVVSPFEGTPAFKAGIKAGDIVVEIDGQKLHGLPLMEVLKKVRGQAGSAISIKIQDGRTGELRQIRMHRQLIRIPPVRYAIIKPGIAYVRIKNFQESAPRDVENALKQIGGTSGGHLKGLILDLRDNPGGLFDEAIEVADLLLASGRITSVIGRNSGLNREFRATGRNKFRMPPTVVLINKGTASASEILAGALQGRPNFLVMGERSFGKASVQAVFPMRRGMALRITTAHYYTADGRDIDAKGLVPDVLVEDASDEIREKLDVLRNDQLEGDPCIRQALDFLIQSGQPSAAGQAPPY